MGAGAAPATVGASAPPVAVAGVVRLAVVASLGVVLGEPIAVQPGQDSGEEKEDAVHDSEGETGLQQGTCFVGVDAHAISCEIAKYAKVDVVG